MNRSGNRLLAMTKTLLCVLATLVLSATARAESVETFTEIPVIGSAVVN